MHKFPFMLAASVLVVQPALASVETDVVSIVHQWAQGFNTGDKKSIAESCAQQAAIVDDFPPHEWNGTGACTRWHNDFQVFANKAKITDAVITIGKAEHVDVTADVAYVVAPVTLTYQLKGKPAKLNGILTAVLRKGAASWHITALAWADL